MQFIDDFIKNPRLYKNEYMLLSQKDKIDFLSELAVHKGLIKPSEQLYYINKYNKLKNGDKLFLTCIKSSGCKLDNFERLMNQSSLHKLIALKVPSMKFENVNQVVGKINESIMNKYFQSTGWKKIEGEVGRNGIDGLFIKTKGGHVTDVLFVESKYNKSVLQQTKHGQQMTKEWLSHKVDNLIKKYPNNIEYQEIKKYIDKDIYRNKLWNMKVEKDNIIISLKNISDNSKSVKISPITGSHKMKINYQGNQLININNPTNNFHEQLVKWYKESI